MIGNGIITVGGGVVVGKAIGVGGKAIGAGGRAAIGAGRRVVSRRPPVGPRTGGTPMARPLPPIKGGAPGPRDIPIPKKAESCPVPSPASKGVPDDANYAQKSFRGAFSDGGKFAGSTVDDVASALRYGALKPASVPVEYIIRDGKPLILNTRSAQALEKAGCPRSTWRGINMTGNPAAEARLTEQLRRNKLTSQGIPSVRPSGGK